MFRRFFHPPKASANFLVSQANTATPAKAAIEYTCQLSGERYTWPQDLWSQETKSALNNEHAAKPKQRP
jgi:hypothetical protein